jgi:trehalose 6-phosphate phosphatase
MHRQGISYLSFLCHFPHIFINLQLTNSIFNGFCSKVYNFVKLAELYYAGSHGMDIKGPAKGFSRHKRVKQSLLYQPANDYLPMIDEVYRQLLEKTKSTPGAKVENHKFCASVHFRCVDKKVKT